MFHDTVPDLDRARPAFRVLKDCTSSSLTVTSFKLELRLFFMSAFPNDISMYGMESFTCDFKAIFSNYVTLRALFQSGQWQKVDEVRLFMEDFLLDIQLWSSFGFESLYELGILSAPHWRDMQNWSTERQIDDLEQLLDMGDDDDDPTNTSEAVASNAQPDSEQWLWEAAKNGRIDEIHQHLMRRTRPVDMTCLTVALQHGHNVIFWLLFNFSSAVQGAPTSCMEELIYDAARFGNLEVLQSLISQANIQSAPHLAELCYKPLKAAVEGDHELIVSYFISIGLGFESDSYWERHLGGLRNKRPTLDDTITWISGSSLAR